MGSDPWTPSKALPWGPYSTPRPPAGKGNDLCMSARHHYKPNKLLVVVVSGGGSHEIFTNREGGSTIFPLFPGGIKNLTESFIPFLPHPPPPRELKNDNSLRCLLLKYRLIFLRILRVFDEPLGDKYLSVFQGT